MRNMCSTEPPLDPAIPLPLGGRIEATRTSEPPPRVAALYPWLQSIAPLGPKTGGILMPTLILKWPSERQ